MSTFHCPSLLSSPYRQLHTAHILSNQINKNIARFHRSFLPSRLVLSCLCIPSTHHSIPYIGKTHHRSLLARSILLFSFHLDHLAANFLMCTSRATTTLSTLLLCSCSNFSPSFLVSPIKPTVFFFFYCSTTKMIYPSLCHYCMQFFSPPPHPPIVLSLFLTYCCTSLYYHLHTPSLGFYPNRFCSYSLSISFFFLHFLPIYITAVLVFLQFGPTS